MNQKYQINYAKDFLIKAKLEKRVGTKMINLSFAELVARILFAIFLGGIVGYEREIKGQSAGFRTHILVCVGATMIALIQIQATNQILNLASGSSDYLQILSMDNTRLTAQIISGIGFLGAGAIIVTKRSVSGLTTAASIWSTASIGIALGMGFYKIAFVGAITIMLTLSIIKKNLPIIIGENLVIRYVDEKVQEKISTYFHERTITYFSTQFQVETDLETNSVVYTEHYTLNVSSKENITEIIKDIGNIESVIYVSSQGHIT